jgi:hypothetical protein
LIDSASIVAYNAVLVNHPSTCKSETRVCSNGVLSGTYAQQSCKINFSGRSVLVLEKAGSEVLTSAFRNL